MNSSTIALELRSWLAHQQRAFFLTTGVIAALILPLYGLSKAVDLSLPTRFEMFAERLQGAGGHLLAFLSAYANTKLELLVYTTLAGITCASACKEDYGWARDNVVLDNCLQKKMILIGRFLNGIAELSELLEAHPDFVATYPAASSIVDFSRKDMQEGDMLKLFQLCRSSTLQGEPSFFSLHGRVLAAFKLIYQLKKRLEPLLMALGELDAYRSCAQLYKEFEHHRVKFCFTRYKKNTNPALTFQEFWNPFIDPDNVITNDVILDGPFRKNMIITGPNAGGKSTLIKAIPINLILSQSIGLAAASYAEITPFYAIATYLNVVDDIAAGNSLFMAQVLRAQEMVNVVEQTPKDALSFIALDEMFNGTSAKESTASAYSVIMHIGRYANNISAVATHFPLLTQLENEMEAFANYKVSVHVDDQGIHYPFKLEKGFSNQHVALDILKQEGYDYGIITQASEILENM